MKWIAPFWVNKGPLETGDVPWGVVVRSAGKAGGTVRPGAHNGRRSQNTGQELATTIPAYEKQGAKRSEQNHQESNGDHRVKPL